MNPFSRPRLLLIALVVCFAWQDGGAQVSSSKLSAHLIGGYTPGSSNIVSGKPRLLKVLDFPPGMVAAMRDYKAKAPEGKIVVRIYSPQMYDMSSNATASATHFWNTILQPALNSISASDRALIDYLEGPNEGQTPTLGYPWDQRTNAAIWFNQFWTNLTPQMVSAGYKPCIGSIAVGNPGGNPSDWQPLLSQFVPALRQAKAAGGSWSYHSYTLQYTTDLNVEIHDSLRYRQFYSFFAQQFPDITDIPLVITEGGVDQVGDRLSSGWQARGSAANYQRWLNWFDYQMQQDPYVVGCTLFQNGDTWWASFDLETIMPGAQPGVVPIAGWFGNYLKMPTAVPPAPTGLSITTNNPIRLSWTNLPANPTTYAIRRSTNSGGPYTLLADKISEGLQGTSYTDAAVTSGVTYYYVVSAVNSVGEGTTSVEVSTTPGLPKINCGGLAAGNFSDDIFFNAGQGFSVTNTVDMSGAANPAPMPVYQAQRYGNLTYTIPNLVPATSYKMRLHFCEMYIYFNGPGMRIFNVYLNGAKALNNFDIYAAAGGQFKANIQEFNAIADSNGKITVRLETVIDNASMNGIEVLANPNNSLPAAPANLTANISSGAVSLNWFAPVDATSFKVKRGTGGPLTVIATDLTRAAFTDVSFVPNTTYFYAVSAANAFGESLDSNQVSARPTNGLPDAVATALTWTNSAIFSGNTVYFRTTVKNQGSATIAANTLGIGLLVDGVQIGYVGAGNSALAAGASATYIANGGPNNGAWIATPGTHTITAVVDDLNRFAEGNEGNNLFEVPLTTSLTGHAINVGGSGVGIFTVDNFYDGSLSTFTTTNSIDLNGAFGAAPAAVYQSERWGSFSYTMPNLVPGRLYKTRLHFAEISPSVTAVGQRQFNVSINGSQVLTNLDIVLVAGGKFKAVTRQFNTTADGSGKITVQFSTGAANAPKCNGIEVFAYTNTAPVLAAIPNKTVNTGATLSFTNFMTDSDLPADSLSFTIVSGPAGATVSTSGIFSWTAPQVTSGQTNAVTLRVTDSGTPALTDSKTFSIIVIAPPRISLMTVTAGNANLTWQTFPGKTYRVEFKDDLTNASWTQLGSDTFASGNSLSISEPASGQRFYRIVQVD